MKRKHCGSTDANSSTTETLLKWAENNGAIVSNMRFTDTGASLRGVSAACHISQGKIIASVPEKLILSYTTATASSVGTIINSFLLASPAETQLLESKGDPFARQVFTLSCYLAHEQFHVESSFWQPYLESLPSDFNLPISWPLLELNALLSGTNLHFIVQERQTMLREWTDLANRALAPTQFTMDQILWAYSAISSRSFPRHVSRSQFDLTNELQVLGSGLEVSELCLYPILDMMNHKYGQEIVWESSKETGIRFLAASDIRENDELWNNYGSKGNELLLANYGFVLPANASDHAQITLNIHERDPLYNVRKGAFESLGLTRVHRLFSEAPQLDAALLNAVKVLVGSEAEVMRMKLGKEDLGKKVAVSSVMALYALVQGSLDKMESGCILMEAFECSTPVQVERRNACREYRNGQHAIFKNALESCISKLKILVGMDSPETRQYPTLITNHSPLLRKCGVMDAVDELLQLPEAEEIFDPETMLALNLVYECHLGEESQFSDFFMKLEKTQLDAAVIMGEAASEVQEYYNDAIAPFLEQSDFFSCDCFSASRFLWASSVVETHGVTFHDKRVVSAMGLDFAAESFPDGVLFGVVY
ncbi:hypothetical protein HDU78_001092 [Chytriomyces hyalinus]|nr:hypothetical protein HDU78_001092 [Chytriomyces hyalinus]